MYISVLASILRKVKISQVIFINLMFNKMSIKHNIAQNYNFDQ